MIMRDEGEVQLYITTIWKQYRRMQVSLLIQGLLWTLMETD